MAGLCLCKLDLKRKNSVQFRESSQKRLSIDLASSYETLLLEMRPEKIIEMLKHNFHICELEKYLLYLL